MELSKQIFSLLARVALYRVVFTIVSGAVLGLLGVALGICAALGAEYVVMTAIHGAAKLVRRSKTALQRRHFNRHFGITKV